MAERAQTNSTDLDADIAFLDNYLASNGALREDLSTLSHGQTLLPGAGYVQEQPFKETEEQERLHSTLAWHIHHKFDELMHQFSQPIEIPAPVAISPPQRVRAEPVVFTYYAARMQAGQAHPPPPLFNGQHEQLQIQPEIRQTQQAQITRAATSLHEGRQAPQVPPALSNGVQLQQPPQLVQPLLVPQKRAHDSEPKVPIPAAPRAAGPRRKAKPKPQPRNPADRSEEAARAILAGVSDGAPAATIARVDTSSSEEGVMEGSGSMSPAVPPTPPPTPATPASSNPSAPAIEDEPKSALEPEVEAALEFDLDACSTHPSLFGPEDKETA